MARIPKRRKITIDNELYYWRAEGDDGCIVLSVIHGRMQKVPNASLLWSSFLYHEDGRAGNRYNHLVITPYIVAQVIRHGLSKGWQPLERGEDMYLGLMDEKIDLRLETNMVRAIKSKNRPESQVKLNLINYRSHAGDCLSTENRLVRSS